MTAEDYDFWLLLARAGAQCRFIPSIQGVYRIHANNSSAQLSRHLGNVSKVMRNHIWSMNITDKQRARLWRNIESKMWVSEAKELLIKRKFSQGLRRISDAVVCSPVGVLDYFYRKIQKKIKSKFHKTLIFRSE